MPKLWGGSVGSPVSRSAVSPDSSTTATSWRDGVLEADLEDAGRLRAAGASCVVDAAAREDAVRTSLLNRTTRPSPRSR